VAKRQIQVILIQVNHTHTKI